MKKSFFIVLGILIGSLAGFLYWKYIGCLSGNCPIKSNPWISTFYGSLLGGLTGSIMKDLFKKKKAH